MMESRSTAQILEEGAFIGSDTMLVAPVRVGKGAKTGAGSVVTRDVPPGALVLEYRHEQSPRLLANRPRLVTRRKSKERWNLAVRGGLIAVVFLLVVYGSLSAAKSAIINLRHARIGQLVDENRDKAQLVARLAEDSTHLLATFQLWVTLTAGLAVGIAALTFVTPLQTTLARVSLLSGIAAPLSTGFVIFVVVLALLILGDLVPEAVGAAKAETFAFFFARPVAAMVLISSPLIKFIIWISSSISSRMGGQSLLAMPFITEEEIMTLVDAGQEVGAIEQDEKEMIYSVFALGDTLAREVMVPRIDIVALDVRTSLKDALDVVISAGHSRIPTYEETIDNIVGVLYAKDLLELWRDDRGGESLRDELRTPYFVPESKPVDELLEEMQQRKVHMVIVVDEYGGTAGVVTLEDIVEEIVGEIQDEYDAEEPIVTPVRGW